MGWTGAPNIGEHVPEAEAVVATTIVIVVELDKARGGPTRGSDHRCYRHPSLRRRHADGAAAIRRVLTRLKIDDSVWLTIPPQPSRRWTQSFAQRRSAVYRRAMVIICKETLLEGLARPVAVRVYPAARDVLEDS